MSDGEELDEVERAEQAVERLQDELRNCQSRAFLSAAMLVPLTLVAVIAALYLDGFASLALICLAALSAVAFVFDLNRKRVAAKQCRREYEQAKGRLNQTQRGSA
jgi:type III secretory pathway component EscV